MRRTPRPDEKTACQDFAQYIYKELTKCQESGRHRLLHLGETRKGGGFGGGGVCCNSYTTFIHTPYAGRVYF